MWKLDHKESWAPKNWWWTVVLQNILESPFNSKEIKPVNAKGNQSWIFTGKNDAKAEIPIIWPPDVKNWLLRKDPDAGKAWRQEKKGMTEEEMLGWHHQLNGHEIEQSLGVCDGQGRLACCSPWGPKESDTIEWLNWTENHHIMLILCHRTKGKLKLYLWCEKEHLAPMQTIHLWKRGASHRFPAGILGGVRTRQCTAFPILGLTALGLSLQPLGTSGPVGPWILGRESGSVWLRQGGTGAVMYLDLLRAEGPGVPMMQGSEPGPKASSSWENCFSGNFPAQARGTVRSDWPSQTYLVGKYT